MDNDFINVSTDPRIFKFFCPEGLFKAVEAGLGDYDIYISPIRYKKIGTIWLREEPTCEEIYKQFIHSFA